MNFHSCSSSIYYFLLRGLAHRSAFFKRNTANKSVPKVSAETSQPKWEHHDFQRLIYGANSRRDQGKQPSNVFFTIMFKMSNKQFHFILSMACGCVQNYGMSGQEIMALAGKATKHLKFIWQLDRHNKIGKGKASVWLCAACSLHLYACMFASLRTARFLDTRVVSQMI